MHDWLWKGGCYVSQWDQRSGINHSHRTQILWQGPGAGAGCRDRVREATREQADRQTSRWQKRWHVSAHNMAMRHSDRLTPYSDTDNNGPCIWRRTGRAVLLDMHPKETDVCSINLLKGKHGLGTVMVTLLYITTVTEPATHRGCVLQRILPMITLCIALITINIMFSKDVTYPMRNLTTNRACSQFHAIEIM